jgi:hypothetical protein
VKEQVLLEKRKNKCIASILSAKEKEFDPYLDQEQSAKLRKVILDEINDFYNLAVDLLGDNMNEFYLDMVEMLEDIHGAVLKE